MDEARHYMEDTKIDSLRENAMIPPILEHTIWIAVPHEQAWRVTTAAEYSIQCQGVKRFECTRGEFRMVLEI